MHIRDIVWTDRGGKNGFVSQTIYRRDGGGNGKGWAVIRYRARHGHSYSIIYQWLGNHSHERANLDTFELAIELTQYSLTRDTLT